jgi:hypothetical protein
MYPIILAIHNIVRWVVVILAIFALVRAYVGWFGKRDWTEMDRRVGVFFSVSIDIQLLLGLLLYIFFSDITRSALRDFGAAMGNPGMRFFAIEHVFYMVLALVFAHLGSFLPKKATEAVSKHRRAAIWFTLAVLMILLGIPWSRPLFPGLG